MKKNASKELQKKEEKDSGGYVQGGLKSVRKLLCPDDDSSLSGDSSNSSKMMKKKKLARKEKKSEASGSTSGPRMLPEDDVKPADEDKKSPLVWEQKVQIRKRLNIGHKVTDEQLKAEEWEAYVSAAASKWDLKTLASICQVDGYGTHIEILARIVDWYKGGN